MVKNCVPSYISEICPAGVRGFMSGTLTVLVSLGNTWGVGMSRAFANETRRVGWIIPVAVQFIPALGMFVFVPFTPESPRWLVLKGRNEEAVKALNRVRPREEVRSGMTHLEVEAFEQAVLAARERRDGRWTDLARGTFRRRTIVSIAATDD
jgi:MFS family permease